MSLTHPNPFEWRTNPPNPEMASFLREASAKAPPKPIKADVVRQPPAFRKPKLKGAIPKPRYQPVESRRSAEPRPESTSGQLRALLEARGPMTRMELSKLTGVKSARVGDLMKQDKRVLLDKSVFPQRYYVASNPPVGVDE